MGLIQAGSWLVVRVKANWNADSLVRKWITVEKDADKAVRVPTGAIIPLLKTGKLVRRRRTCLTRK